MITRTYQGARPPIGPRRLRTVLSVFAFAVACTGSAQAIRTTVDGVLVRFPDVQPSMSKGRVMVPVRGVFEHMNASVVWDADTQTVTAHRGADEITLPVNTSTATVNGRLVFLDAPATVVAGRTMVPLRFLSETLGANVEWLDATRTVAITNAAVRTQHDIAKYSAMPEDAASLAPLQQSQQTHSINETSGMTDKQHELYNSMRKIWEDHVSWTRMYIISAANNLRNMDATTNRLLTNQDDIGNLIKPMYGESAGEKLSQLLRQHILIAADIISAAKNNDSQTVSDKKQEWYDNADEIATFLHGANPSNWSQREMHDMMHEHLDLTLDEATAELKGNYATGVRKYDQIHVQILEMADMLSQGIISQFPDTYPAGTNGWSTDGSDYNTMHINQGTVVPFLLNQRLSSNESQPGDKFTANVDTGRSQDYQGLPIGSVLEGHVDFTQAKSGNTPGIVGLAFDRVRMPDGHVYSIDGSLIGLDSKSVSNVDGRLVAKSGSSSNNNLKYVGYGAGAGALLAVVTNGNIVSNSVIGAALGYLYGEIQKNPSKSRNVVLASGTRFGVNLTNDFSFRVPTKG